MLNETTGWEKKNSRVVNRKCSQCATLQIKSVILEGTKLLVDSARSHGYLSGETDSVKEPLPSQECRFAALCEMAKELPLVEDGEQQECTQLLVTEDGCTSHVDLFSQMTENREDQAAVVTLMGEEYIIPSNSTFLLSDFTRMQPLVHGGYNKKIIVSIWNTCRLDKLFLCF